MAGVGQRNGTGFAGDGLESGDRDSFYADESAEELAGRAKKNGRPKILCARRMGSPNVDRGYLLWGFVLTEGTPGGEHRRNRRYCDAVDNPSSLRFSVMRFRSSETDMASPIMTWVL